MPQIPSKRRGTLKNHQVCLLALALLALVSVRLAQVNRAEQKTGAATTDTPRSHTIVSADELQCASPAESPPALM